MNKSAAKVKKFVHRHRYTIIASAVVVVLVNSNSKTKKLRVRKDSEYLEISPEMLGALRMGAEGIFNLNNDVLKVTRV